MNREFFTAHKFPVLFIFFIENGPKSLVTIDAAGHLFIWKYSQEYVTAKQRFEPAQKLRIELKSNKYTKIKENKIFPTAGQKDFDATKPLQAA